ncbi:hypothetical protein OG462_28400 [Streptomyces sp. NBC_01077]|uniref:hypothetical protein n=1 Tax=Streptomyces sp. NBC_01077 TaxID=2903746 RepID=UPI00386DBD9E|nr:hypothetical protein OG462_28400 [Streptomyces sp. NBC_01077]
MRSTPSARLLRGALTAGVALGLSATALSSPAQAADGSSTPGNGRGGLGGPQADMSWDTAERVHVF